MNKKIPKALFIKLAREAAAGRPLWSLLWLNEYLGPNDPLRSAIAERARNNMADEKYRASAIERAAAGARLCKLTSEEKRSVLSIREESKAGRRSVPKLRPFRAVRAERNLSFQRQDQARAEAR